MRGRSSHIHDVEYRGKAKARGTFVCVKRRLHSSTFTQPGAETTRAGGARSSASTPLSGTMLRRGSPRAGHTPLCCDQLLHGAGWSCMDSPHAQLCGRRHRHIRCSSCIVEGHDGPLFAASLPRLTAYTIAHRYGLRCGSRRNFYRLLRFSGTYPVDGPYSNR